MCGNAVVEKSARSDALNYMTRNISRHDNELDGRDM